MAETPPATTLPRTLPTLRHPAPLVYHRDAVADNFRPEHKAGPLGEHVDLSTRLARLAAAVGAPHTSLQFAAYLDAHDDVAIRFRPAFAIPHVQDIWPESYRRRMQNVEPAKQPARTEGVYLAGNSLGLCPVDKVKRTMNHQLDVWASRAVLGHTENPDHYLNWVSIETSCAKTTAKLVGARRSEVVVMGSLTSNLHTLLTSFYRPTPTRSKILFEAKAFPSDQYAFASHAQLHGLGPDALIEVEPRKGEWSLRTADILDIIDKRGHEIAVVLFSGVQYYTGQLFDMQTITRAARLKGCLVGWDLAHAIGNVRLHLHDWGVDFAAWCSYKYLCGGPGAIAGLFVHERHENHNRLQGWWGHDPETRFAMPRTFAAQRGAPGWQHSNPSVFSLLPLYESLRLFHDAGHLPSPLLSGTQVSTPHADTEFGLAMSEKQAVIGEYLEILLRGLTEWWVDLEDMAELAKLGDGPAEEEGKVVFTIITPPPPARGSQLSLLFYPTSAMELIDTTLRELGVLGDERNPGVIRLAPHVLFNTYTDVLRAVQALESALKSYALKKEANDGRLAILLQERQKKEAGEKRKDSDDEDELVPPERPPSPPLSFAGRPQRPVSVPDALAEFHREQLHQGFAQAVSAAEGKSTEEIAREKRLEKMKGIAAAQLVQGTPHVDIRSTKPWPLPEPNRLADELTEKLKLEHKAEEEDTV